MKTLLLLLITTFAYGQTQDEYAYPISKTENGYVNNNTFKVSVIGLKTKIKYYDEKDNQINKEKFYGSLDKTVNIDTYSQLEDSLIIAKLYPRKNLFAITKLRQKNMLRYLDMISGKPSDSTAITIIHFYSGQLDQPSGLLSSYWRADEKEYTRKLPEGTKVNQYFVYQNRFGADDKGAKKNGWIYDKTGYIEKLFIPAHFNFNSAVIVMPDGRCFTYYGEHGPKEVREGLQMLTGSAK